MTPPEPPEDHVPQGDPRLHLAHEWLTRAETDLAAASALMNEARFAFVIAFHAQQAAEKALKAFLAWQDVPVRRTHNIEELLSECILTEPAFAALRTSAVSLTPFAVDTRYPGEDPTPDEAQDAYRAAGEVLARVRSVLPSIPPDVGTSPAPGQEPGTG